MEKLIRPSESWLETGVVAIDAEISALIEMKSRLDESFVKALDLINRSEGRVVVVGMGKSGHIGKKIAATLASMGSPSFFVHPGEAIHGDLGMIRSEDIVLMISNSGETDEILALLPHFERQGNAVIGMTGGMQSTLARASAVVLDVSVRAEACPLGLAPTSSTTCSLVMGDALAVALATIRQFQAANFAQFHPGGRLGRRLLARVKDAMNSSALPLVGPKTPLLEVIHVMTNSRMGVALVHDGPVLKGIITDGDLRRFMESGSFSLEIAADQIMNSNPQTISGDEMLTTAEERMRQARIGCLVVINDDGATIGLLQIFD